jgi:hypothetical protein
MKNIYPLLLIFVLLASCNTQRQPTVTDSIPNDSVTYENDENANTSASQYCGHLVIEVLKSSARFKELSAQLSAAIKKNGGEIGVVLDKSPFPNVDKAMSYSENYEMQVTENYPDRQVNIAHFNFDPHKKQLYEYNVIRDQFINVDFNTSLLDNAGEYCK